MQHFSCDICGRMLNDERHVLQVNVTPAYDPDEISESDLDVDHLEQVAELLAEDPDATGSDDDEPCSMRYDLCTSCRRRFLKDPLGREALRRFKFSTN